MPHLSNLELSTCTISYLNQQRENLKFVVGLAFKQSQIKICDKSVRDIVKKWGKSCSVGDHPRPNKNKHLVTNTCP
jgi:hypothetical protein